MNCEEIKIVIWDLDDTFWSGTLSEGTVVLIKDKIQIIHELLDRGIMCSISSKNDFKTASEELEKIGVFDLFIFPRINWNPKGEQVREILQSCSLRPENALFVDDNNLNREEVRFYNPGIRCAPSLSSDDLCDPVFKGKADPKHARLNHYKVLERKNKDRGHYSSNLAFLKQSNIVVSIEEDCLPKIDRIHELISRTNQLNFTKRRVSLLDLESSLRINKSFVISVADKYGDYGICGFVQFDENETVCHFLFSCRILGMGIESFVWQFFGCPPITISGEVSAKLVRDPVTWVTIGKTQTPPFEIPNSSKAARVLLKGPCDMSSIYQYIRDNAQVKTEFNYVNEAGVLIESASTTTHILESLENPLCHPGYKDIFQLPFSDRKMYETSIFDDLDFVVLSTLQDASMGLYQNTKTKKIVAFGSFVTDFTNEENWDNIIARKNVWMPGVAFTKESLISLKENYRYLGRLSPQESFQNLREIFEQMKDQTKLVLVLGSETKCALNKQKEWADRHLYHKELNNLIRNWANENDRLFVVDVNKYIRGQLTFDAAINHYTREVYYALSKDIKQILSQNGVPIKTKNKLLVLRSRIHLRLKYLFSGSTSE